MADETQIQSAPVDPPEGAYSTRVDDKGRLKLPEDFKAFLQTLPDKRFFVTMLDTRTARVYPIDAWKATKKILEEDAENPQDAENLLFVAAAYGSMTTLDKEGRVLIPPTLRRELGLENRPASVIWKNKWVEVYSEDYFKERLEEAKAANAENRAAMLKKVR